MPELSVSLCATWLVALVATVATGLFAERYKSQAAVTAILINAVVTSIPAVLAITRGTIELQIDAGLLIGDLALRIDGLSAWFILLVNFSTLMGAVYGMGYMKQYTGQPRNLSLHWSLFVVFHLSMVWVCMVQNSLAFLIVWEIMSLSSMLLVMFEHHKPETVRAGINYLIQMHIGVIFLTIAFLWVYFEQQSFDFEAIGTYFSQTPPVWLFLLFFTGFGIKAGFIPLHTWLPHAHPAAPSHVSGVMSGVIVKMGIYGILRVVSLVATPSLLRYGEIVLTLSILTALYGILNSAVHRDIKKMLAFCTIENMGIIGIGIGVGMIGQSLNTPLMMLAGYGGALLHTLNHSLFKSLLFFASGNIYTATHTRNMEHLGGLIKKMPVTAVAFLTGAMAIGGLPPFNGFISEFMIYSGLIAGIQSQAPETSTLMTAGIAGLAMAGGLSLITFTKTFGIVFLGVPRRALPHEPKEVSWLMLLPLLAIMIPVVIVGLFPGLLFVPLMSAVAVFSPHQPLDQIALTTLPLLTRVGLVSGFFILLVLLILFVRKLATNPAGTTYSQTWGCGYTAPMPSMQYTGKSFSKNLAKLFSLIAIEDKSYKEISASNIFPRHRTFKSRYLELFESRIFDKAISQMLQFFNLFLFIHNGRVQSYILYGIFFIVLILAGTMLNLI